MISSELPEVLRLSHRIAVMCEGRLTGILPGGALAGRHHGPCHPASKDDSADESADTNAKTGTGGAKAARRGAAQQKLLAFASLIALVIVFSLASPNFFQMSNIMAILQATSVNGVLAIGVTLVIITGGIDLSIGTLMTFCAVMTGVVLTWLGAAADRSASSPPSAPACCRGSPRARSSPR